MYFYSELIECVSWQRHIHNQYFVMLKYHRGSLKTRSNPYVPSSYMLYTQLYQLTEWSIVSKSNPKHAACRTS